MLVRCLIGVVFVFSLAVSGISYGLQPPNPSGLDVRVLRFLNYARGSWADLNVSYEDGKMLHNLVLKGNFQNILEIGTSTGHSTIWLAWAASKTGGKVTTIEIDKGRHETAIENFKKAGVAQYIDSRLGDAHELLPTLKGQFDFVFCDADKEWYLQYFLDMEPKISINGCYTAHNVLRGWSSEVRKFVEYVKRNPKFKTSIERGSGEGISISCKIAK